MIPTADDSGAGPGPLPGAALRVLAACLLVPVPVLAVTGNLLIMAAVARIQSLWTPTNAFVVSLAAADFLVAVLVMPFSLVRSVDRWRFGDGFCRVHFILDVTFCTSSIFNLSCIALERYVAVCDPLRYPARMSPRRVAALLLLCWTLPLLISVLCVSLGASSPAPAAPSNSSGAQACPATFSVPFAFASSSMSFFVPMVFMLFTYGRIYVVAQKQARWIHAVQRHSEQLQMNRSRRRATSRPVRAYVERFTLKRESKAAKTLGLIMGVFLVCWLPFFCLNMIHPLKGYTVSPLILEASTWLGYANSSLNPFLYVLFNKNYRRLFAAWLDCGTLGRRLSLKFGRPTHSVVMLETISR
ncbi:5-hydroxytryptamine receptor 4-like [Betta splendens]|uniref:5-hydroxytryptamine receptor 4-like n=1 Tax=Betta splendens TaxID=158456 RepID=A0A6P7NTQ0_BETSP|nr:5-hydroxytryptamine receptor 4-like [Betta splendens]